jgi:hypothetical protein
MEYKEREKIIRKISRLKEKGLSGREISVIVNQNESWVYKHTPDKFKKKHIGEKTEKYHLKWCGNHWYKYKNWKDKSEHHSKCLGRAIDEELIEHSICPACEKRGLKDSKCPVCDYQVMFTKESARSV